MNNMARNQGLDGETYSVSGVSETKTNTTTLYQDASSQGGSEHEIGRKENKLVFWSRLLVFMVIAISAAVAGLFTWKFTNQKNEEQFESDVSTSTIVDQVLPGIAERLNSSSFFHETEKFIGSAKQITDALIQTENNVVSSLESFATSITSTRLALNQSWPNFIVPDFEERGMKVREITDIHLLAIVVRVYRDQVPEYDQYHTENAGWYNQSLSVAGLEYQQVQPKPYITLRANRSATDIRITDDVGVAPFFMFSYSSPPFKNGTNLFYNSAWDADDDFVFQRRFEFMDLTKLASRGIILPSRFTIGVDRPSGVNVFYQQPLFNDFSRSRVEAYVNTVYSWDTTLSKVLTKEEGTVYVVIEAKGCNTSVTYLVEGSNVTDIGMDGVYHDVKYEGYKFERGISLSLDEIGRLSNEFDDGLVCHYSARVYPTDNFREIYETNEPLLYTAIVVCIFWFTAIVFITYDWFVQLRQTTVLTSAIRTDAVVANMFPEQFRDQILDQTQEQRSKIPKSYIKKFVEGQDEESGFADDNTQTTVADLFPHATVLFADIEGFTAWSSVRDPTQVFQLLEAIYGVFDEIAKKRSVFKVETVGDSYVAACGVPKKRRDHAVVMARFASDCISALLPTVLNLEKTLGPGTGDLRMRFGLHSGPITAGVLRGERARFQLFGTTVNTASRIEATGSPNRIHASEQTADLLIKAGKTAWIEKREQKVWAKGLGQLNTYWVKVKPLSGDRKFEKRRETESLSSSASDSDQSIAWGETVTPSNLTNSNTQRLVSWNTVMLSGLLERVLTSRASKQDVRSFAAGNEVPLAAAEDFGKVNVIDEIAEIIQLPDFEGTQTRGRTTVKMNEKARNQLNRLVSIIAASYQNNRFHNFEHASHVAMSVQKLLSRIVAPDIDMSGEEDAVASALHDHTYGINSDPLTQFAVVFSALVHDIDHRGVPNNVLAKEDPDLASVYNNQSIAEQNSIDLAWSFIEQEDMRDLQACIYRNEEEKKRFRQILINCVMATDIFSKELSAMRKARWNKAFDENALVTDVTVDRNRKATIVIEHLIQASDVAHTMQHWHVYRKWNENLFMEMYLAFHVGRSDKNPADGWYEGEIWFFDNYIIPLAKKLDSCGVFGVSSDEYLSYAVSNRKEWEAKGQEIIAELLRKAEALAS